MDCKLCDYYKSLGSETAKCSFTGIVFSNDVDSLEIEYPCRNTSYEQYLSRKTGIVKNVNTLSFKNDDWRYAYKHYHAVDATDRCKRRAI